MNTDGYRLTETVTLSQARDIIRSAAHQQSFLLLSPPGVGKSEMIRDTAVQAGMECRSLLGTQLAPEDVSGVPRIENNRSIFCPPRVLLPESDVPFCLFLDELPACAPDVQKSFYSLLLERRVGEYRLPKGTWVVAAGNRTQDRAMVRTISSALINRVTILNVGIDVDEWLSWAESNRVLPAVIAYIRGNPQALMREIPDAPVPFSTPRSWTALSKAIQRAEAVGALSRCTLLALAAGAISKKDVMPFCDWYLALRAADESVLRLGWEGIRKSDVLTLSLSERAIQVLDLHSIKTLGILISHSVNDLKPLADFDDPLIEELVIALEKRGLRLRAEPSESDSVPTITLGQAQSLVRAMADEQSLLFLSPPGVGKSEAIRQVAEQSQLDCHSLLGTQIAPEDVSGIPRIEGERSVFCPPRVLLPENGKPFCLFLDELPASPADIQKAFYSLLLERRIGEHALPSGTWVVAAGNRTQDRALVRSLSSALINRVFIIQIRMDRKEWFTWASANKVRPEILSFLSYMPQALMRGVPDQPVPFSTPRSWVSLSRSMDIVEQQGCLNQATLRALAFGTLSAEDAALFCTMAEELDFPLLPVEQYFADPDLLPSKDTARWFIINRIRRVIQDQELPVIPEVQVNQFLEYVPSEFRFALMIDLVNQWAKLGASAAMLKALREVTGCGELIAE